MLAERAKEIRLSEQESGKQPSKKLSWPSEPRWEPFTSNLIKRLHQSKSFLPPFIRAYARRRRTVKGLTEFHPRIFVSPCKRFWRNLMSTHIFWSDM